MTETDLQRRIQLALTDDHTRLWRNNSGQGWQGTTFGVRNGVLVSGEARRVHYGLCVGSSDLIGFHRGRFLAVEVKSARGRTTQEQEAFIRMVLAHGGLAGIARSEDDAVRILTVDTKGTER